MQQRVDTAAMRKARGAFFTPPPIADLIARWAIRTPGDSILEPSCGDAVFLLSAAEVLRSVDPHFRADQLVGFDVHEDSLADARGALERSGVSASLRHSDFFEVDPTARFDAVIGNPPFIRFQGFGGRSRDLAIESARELGVEISGLASSWAAFVLHASRFLTRGGRLGMVLPAELLTVNYAAQIRRFLLERFVSVQVVVFDELVFAGVQADVVVVLADGYRQGSTEHLTVHSARNADDVTLAAGLVWTPKAVDDKWTDALAASSAPEVLRSVAAEGLQASSDWGRTASGIVTGANDFFVVTAERARQLGLAERDLMPILPSGALGRVESMSRARWRHVIEGSAGLLFRPAGDPDAAARSYIAEGERRGLHERYKCRIRTPWWRVPSGTAPTHFVSYMSGLTPRVVANSGRLLHLNSVHGMTVESGLRSAASALPVLALNSASLLSAELVGRTYGGGVLKLEPSEAARWLLPSVSVTARAISARPTELMAASKLIALGDLATAQLAADEILQSLGVGSTDTFRALREARVDMVMRRTLRTQR